MSIGYLFTLTSRARTDRATAFKAVEAAEAAPAANEKGDARPAKGPAPERQRATAPDRPARGRSAR